MRYTTTDGPKKPLNAIQEGSLGGKMGIAVKSFERNGFCHRWNVYLVYPKKTVKATEGASPQQGGFG